MIVIGLTGPIGCGKSTVAGWLAERADVRVVDADVVAREVLAPGSAATTAVLARFGAAVEGPSASVDRAALGRIVFADAVALRDLESIVHPVVRARILEGLAAAERGGVAVLVIEAIKLVEGGLADLCDHVWLVSCSPAVQEARLHVRGLSDEDVRLRISAQVGLEIRARGRATRIIETTGDVLTTRAAVDTAFAADVTDPD